MIPTFDYRRSLPEIEADVTAGIARVIRSGQLLLGPETAAFEAELARFVGARHCVAVASGTTALHLALAALELGTGDRVLTVANTCAPTIAAIRLAGARPVFAEVGETDLMIDTTDVARQIEDGPRAGRIACVLPVHLWGHAADMERIVEIADHHHIPVVEDCAQAHGTSIGGRQVGTFGAIGCFSFYPTKNIGAFGDAGAVVTDDDPLAERLRLLRMYGYRDGPVSHLEGTNGRISEIQAAILRVKLEIYPRWLERRRALAALYDAGIDHIDVAPLARRPAVYHSFHQYVVRTPRRNELAAALAAADIGYGIHYPTPIHAMPAYARFADRALPVTERAAMEILSLPLHESLRDDEVAQVIDTVNRL